MTSGSRPMPRSANTEGSRWDYVVLVVLVAVAIAAKKSGILDPVERVILDSFVSLRAPTSAGRTVIFDIDDNSYKTDFMLTSPLKPAKIAELVLGGLNAGARAVVVDIETDEAEITRLIEDRRRDSPRIPIVWARDATICRADGTICALPVASIPAPTQDAAHGLTLVNVDDDGAVRRYSSVFRLAVQQKDGCACTDDVWPSLAQAVMTVTRAGDRGYSAEPQLLDWLGDRYAIPRIPATAVIEGWDETWWGHAQPIAGRIVLIGGTFRQGRDSHWTPAGDMAGVEIWGNVIETELSGGGLAQMSLLEAVLLDVLVGLALIWLNRRFPAGTIMSLLINAAVVLVLPFAAAFLLHRFSAYWVNLAPVLAGVWMHQWHSRAHRLLSQAHATGAVQTGSTLPTSPGSDSGGTH